MTKPIIEIRHRNGHVEDVTALMTMQLASVRSPAVHADGVDIRRSWRLVPREATRGQWHHERHFSVGLSAGMSVSLYPMGNPVLVVATPGRTFRVLAMASGGNFEVSIRYDGEEIGRRRVLRRRWIDLRGLPISDDERKALEAAIPAWEQALIDAAPAPR